MSPQIVRYADTPDTPWANGRGSTRLLWADAAGERRISVAKLEGPAAFSALPGMARLLLVLDPMRLTLSVGGRTVRLSLQDSLAFAGDEPVELLALDRPGRVVNLMAVASRWDPSLSAAADPPPLAWLALADGGHCGVPIRSGDLVFGTGPVHGAQGLNFRPVRSAAALPTRR